jgi:hypothetical protein
LRKEQRKEGHYRKEGRALTKEGTKEGSKDVTGIKDVK